MFVSRDDWWIRTGCDVGVDVTVDGRGDDDTGSSGSLDSGGSGVAWM